MSQDNKTLNAAAKSLQSCPTLCDPIDGSPPGSSAPGILQARILEWVAISFSNMLSRLVIAFLPRSKCLLISWLLSPSVVILETKKIKSVTVFIVSPSVCHEVMGPDAMILVFWMFSFKPTFWLSSFTFIKWLFSSSISAIRAMHLHIWGYWYFSQQSWFQLVLPPAQRFSWCTLHIS